VWEEAAFCPATVVPDFRMITGFFVEASVAALTNSSPVCKRGLRVGGQSDQQIAFVEVRRCRC
jgi:hypothetical protein